MKLCPVCHRCFTDTTRVCLESGHPALVEGPGIDLEIAGTWVLERLLSEHPSGGTFLARSRKTGQTATVIVRRPPVPEDAEAFDLFVLESSLLAGLQEVSIAGVEEFGPLPFGGAYAVVEPAGDETLRELVDREGGLSISLAASIGRQVALASEALAQSNVPLGEISSDRIGLRRRGSGPAARLVRLPGAPLEGGEGAEVPALGALLYEMLSGKRPPVTGSNGAAPPPIQRARPDLPESLGWLVMQCLHPSPAARPRSAAEVARRLTPFEQVPVEAVEAVEPATPPPAAKPERPPVSAASAVAAPHEPEPPEIEPVPVPVPDTERPAQPPAAELAASPVPATTEAAAQEPYAPPAAPDRPPSPEEISVPAAASEGADPQNEEPELAAEDAAPEPIAPPAKTDDDASRPPEPPADSAITAEIPILRPRYSYRATPPPRKAEEQPGPRPMFLEPPAFDSFEDPPSAVPSPARPRPPRPGARPGAYPMLWQPAPPPPPPAPPPASRPAGLAPGARDAGAQSTPARSTPARSKGGGSPPRQIPISAERSQSSRSFSSFSSGAPTRLPPTPPGASPGAAITPIGALKDLGIDGVTIGEDGSTGGEPAKRGPRPGVVWGTAGAVAALVFGLFWFVVEATPPRRTASTRVAARAVKPVQPPAAAATAPATPSTAVPRSLEPQPAPAGPPAASEISAVAAPSRPDPVRVAASPRPGARDRKPPVSAAHREPSRSAAPAAAVAGTARHGGGGAGGLRDALDAWIDSTNARDLSGHMRFYQPRVNTFYLQRNVSRDYVRREKARLFEGGPVAVAAGEPEIDPSPDGRAATVRFRKRYAVAGGQGEKRGEVLQEMQWIRTTEGWRIAGERDARVIAKQ